MEGMEGIRMIRLQKGIGQEALAAAVGVSASTYRSWEAGTHKPTFRQIRRLAVALGYGDNRKFFRFLDMI